MKKILLLLFALAIANVGFAQTEVDFDLDASSWGWSWQTNRSNVGAILKGLVESGQDQGTVSRGWDPAENWSKYNKIVAVIEKNTGTSGAIQIKNEASDIIAKKYFGTISSQTTITLDFNPADLTSVRQLELYISGVDAEIQISRVYLVEAYKYATVGEDITYDVWGNIYDSEFSGMPDETRIVFTYTAEAQGTYSISDYLNWGAGKIKGCGDNEILVQNINLKNNGDNEVIVKKGDLNAALADYNTEYSYYGVNFGVWDLKDGDQNITVTNTRKSVKAYRAYAYATIGSIGWSSFSCNSPLDFTGLEVEAYIATSADASSVTLNKVNGTVAAGTGLLLKGTAGQQYDIPVAVSGTDYSATNKLVAALSETTITTATAGVNYVLSKDGSDNPIFAKVDKDSKPATVFAGKAYLHLDASPARELTFNFEGETTGITSNKRETITNNGYFDLQGRKVAQPTRGLYIVNGKKVLVK